MNKCYYRIVWENYPSDKSPLNAQNLNKIDVAVDEMDNRIISLDSTKFDKSEAQLLVKYIEYDEDTGIFKITHYNGASYTIDTLLEKLAINFDYDYQTQRLIIELSDGTVKYVDLSALITQYEFLDSDTVHFTISADGKVKADIKEGSIQEKHLRPNYLADIKVESAKAEASAISAEASKTAAASSAETARIKAGEASASAENAENSAEEAEARKTAAASSAETARIKAGEAAASAENAENSKNAADASAANAAKSAGTATAKANAASSSEASASSSAANADAYAKKAQSYAVGTGGVRPNESIDSAKYYYEQSKGISEGLAGALMPMGTVAFENLPALSDAEIGWMYNISNQFTTNGNFKEGSGNVIPAGANVYKTADGFWDILAGTPVATVNGKTGNVILNSYDIGAFPDVIAVSQTDTNLNDYKTSGIYFFDSTHIPVNIPVGVNGWLVVMRRSDTLIKQLWFRQGTINSDDSNTYVRSLNGYDWSDWTRFAVMDDIDEKVNRSGDIMTNNLRFSDGKVQIQLRSTSHSKTGIEWLKGSDGWEGYETQPGISQHNTGGDGTGSMTLCPYPTNEHVYSGNVGLFLEKGKAKIDGKKVITESDDLASNTVNFTSSDTTEPTGWINWTIFTAKMKLSEIMYRVSIIANNIRWLYKKLGTTDISSIGGGTVTGAISKLNTDLGSKQASIKGGASTIADNNLTANRALVSNASGKVEVSAVTATELGYLDGVTGNVQTQLNKKSNGLYVKSITFTAITINAGTYGYHKANATWSGYTPIGIVGVLLNEVAEISLHDFHVAGNEAILGYRNDGTTNLTLRSLVANVLYIKQ